MKCPFRSIIKTENNITTTDYADCYNTECPWYCPETIRRQETSPEMCQRVHYEHKKINVESEKQRRY